MQDIVSKLIISLYIDNIDAINDPNITCNRCQTTSRLSELYINMDCPFCHNQHEDITLCQ